MSIGPHTLSAAERLKSKKEIDALFRSGKAFFIYPLKVCYTIQPASESSVALKMGISAPKKLFRKAVERNYLKRIAREAYRLQKPGLLAACKTQNSQLQLMLIYVAGGAHRYQAVFKSMGQIISRLQQELEIAPQENPS